MTKELKLTSPHTLSRWREAEIYVHADTPKVAYVSGYAPREVLRKYADFSKVAIYLCGPPKMQDFVLGGLEACGVDPQSVKKEKFSF